MQVNFSCWPKKRSITAISLPPKPRIAPCLMTRRSKFAAKRGSASQD